MKKILVIDDEQIFVEAMKDALTQRNYEVFSACDGEEGLEKVESDQPDLIALDVMMPRMNGYEFMCALNARRIIGKQREIPVIVMTAREGMKDVFQFRGVKEYLVKPFEFPDLVQKIESYIGTND